MLHVAHNLLVKLFPCSLPSIPPPSLRALPLPLNTCPLPPNLDTTLATTIPPPLIRLHQ